MGIVHERLLLRQLCDFWHLEFEEVTPIETQQMLFIFSQLQDGRGLRDILYEISILRAGIRGRSKRRKLGIIYWRLKEAQMSGSGRYDTATWAAPRSHSKNNYY